MVWFTITWKAQEETEVIVIGTEVKVIGTEVMVIGTEVMVIGTVVMVIGTEVMVIGTVVMVIGTVVMVIGAELGTRQHCRDHETTMCSGQNIVAFCRIAIYSLWLYSIQTPSPLLFSNVLLWQYKLYIACSHEAKQLSRACPALDRNRM